MLGRIVTPMITPFDRYDNLNFMSLKLLIEHLYRTKTKTIVMGSRIGEGTCITKLERKLLIEKTIEYNQGRMRVFVNLLEDATQVVKDEIRRLNKLAIDGFVIRIPSDIRIAYEGMLQHFRMIHEITDKLFIVDFTEACLPLEEQIELIKKIAEMNNVKAFITNEEEIIRPLAATIDPIKFYTNSDMDFLKLVHRGAYGLYSGMSHLYGETLHTLVQLVKSGQKQETDLLWEIYRDKFETLHDSHPSYIKAAMNHLGYNVGAVRLPLSNLTQENIQQLIKKLKI